MSIHIIFIFTPINKKAAFPQLSTSEFLVGGYKNTAFGPPALLAPQIYKINRTENENDKNL